jgi:hypothetical protein
MCGFKKNLVFLGEKEGFLKRRIGIKDGKPLAFLCVYCDDSFR